MPSFVSAPLPRSVLWRASGIGSVKWIDRSIEGRIGENRKGRSRDREKHVEGYLASDRRKTKYIYKHHLILCPPRRNIKPYSDMHNSFCYHYTNTAALQNKSRLSTLVNIATNVVSHPGTILPREGLSLGGAERALANHTSQKSFFIQPPASLDRNKQTKYKSRHTGNARRLVYCHIRPLVISLNRF